MVFSEIPVPEAYKKSADFRFFLKWFELCLTKIQYDTENLIDLLDPLRCPQNLLWMLADTCGYIYDERASAAFNRLVILNFARLIRNRGSQVGMVYAAEMNLAQFSLAEFAKENPILEDRLEDTSIPVNSVSLTTHTELGYIDLVYCAEKKPTDICTEYVRPLGMYCFAHSGVQINARTKVSVDARLTNLNDGNLNPGPAFIAHYRRSDYASLQKFNYDEVSRMLVKEPRRNVYYRNKDYEKEPNTYIHPGYRTLYSLQLSNNEHIVKALLPSLEEPEAIFSIGFGPQNVDVVYPDNYLKNRGDPLYNLRLNRQLEESLSPRVKTVDSATDILNPRPAVNPVMASLGDAISMNPTNTKYTVKHQDTGKVEVVDVPDSES